MRCTRRLALGALFGAVLSGCGGGGGSAEDTGSSSPLAGGAAGPAPASASGGAGANPVPAPAPAPSPQAFSAFGPSLVASNASDLDAPAVARLADGGNVVLWVQGNEIRGRLTDAAGGLGDTFTAVEAATEGGNPLGLGDVSVAPAGDGGFVIAWRRETTQPMTQFHAVTAVQAKRFTRDASPVWEAQASAGLYGSVSRPVIEPHGDGFVLAWIGEQVLTAPTWAYLQRLSGDGTRLGADVRVDDASGPQEHVGLAPLADGTVVAVWHQRDFTDPNTHFQHMRRFAADLAPLTAAVALPGFRSQTAFPVDAEALDDGRVAIAWGATGENTRPFVRTAVFTPDGQVVSAVQESVLELPPSDLRVMSFGASGYGVAWQVDNAGSRQISSGLFLQRMGLAGDPLGEPQLVDRRLTFWVSPTTGATVRAGSGIDVKGGADGHFVAAFHRADENPNTYLMGR